METDLSDLSEKTPNRFNKQSDLQTKGIILLSSITRQPSDKSDKSVSNKSD